MNLLHTIGLMTRAEHEAALAKADDAAYNSWIKVINERDFYVSEYKELEAKFKRAATDLAAQAEEIAKQDGIIEGMAWEIRGHEETIADLRPDALAMRRKRQRDRELKAAKAAGKVQP